MSWKGVVRSINAEVRRQERARLTHARQMARQQVRDQAQWARQQQRDAVQMRKQLKEQRAADELERARNDAALFQNYLELIVSVHKDSAQPWDWVSIANAPPPNAPAPVTTRSVHAEQRRQAYVPGFFDRLLGREASKRRALDAEYETARLQDTEETRVAAAAHEHAVENWRWLNHLAQGVLNHQVPAYASAMKHLVDLEEIEEELGSSFLVTAVEIDAVAIDCSVRGDDIVPREEVSLTAKGKVSTKAMSPAKYWALYQDHVCSCAIRIARETFALLPVSRVVVNVGTSATDTSTGHLTDVTYLAVHFTRPALERLNFAAIDPSDSMKHFDHRMQFKKTSGFTPVEPITLADQWVRAG